MKTPIIRLANKYYIWFLLVDTQWKLHDNGGFIPVGSIPFITAYRKVTQHIFCVPLFIQYKISAWCISDWTSGGWNSVQTCYFSYCPRVLVTRWTPVFGWGFQLLSKNDSFHWQQEFGTRNVVESCITGIRIWLSLYIHKRIPYVGTWSPSVSVLWSHRHSVWHFWIPSKCGVKEKSWHAQMDSVCTVTPCVRLLTKPLGQHIARIDLWCERET